eukprot:TRINITY_DN2153_c2_g1_i1.p1 TRINITY_DN2153_c2_g1~~TRINITY_DN2153_c2_g1_i1.p1  ORF type:complete len:747 (+),score=124.57 TRINITY_DN2153_c2_g1_i1:301-2541(+)
MAFIRSCSIRLLLVAVILGITTRTSVAGDSTAKALHLAEEVCGNVGGFGPWSMVGVRGAPIYYAHTTTATSGGDPVAVQLRFDVKAPLTALRTMRVGLIKTSPTTLSTTTNTIPHFPAPHEWSFTPSIHFNCEYLGTSKTEGGGNDAVQCAKGVSVNRSWLDGVATEPSGQPTSTLSFIANDTLGVASSVWYLSLESSNLFVSAPFCITVTGVIVTATGEQVMVREQPGWLYTAVVYLISHVLAHGLLVGCVVAGALSYSSNFLVTQAAAGGFVVLFLAFCVWLGTSFITEALVWMAALGGATYALLHRQVGGIAAFTTPSVPNTTASTEEPTKQTGSAEHAITGGSATRSPSVQRKNISPTKPQTPKQIAENSRVAEILHNALSPPPSNPAPRRRSSYNSSNVAGSPVAVVVSPYDWEIPFNELELNQRVGAGTFGEVYKGDWNGQDVAVKRVMLPMEAMDEGLITDFKNEIVLMSNLRHPHIVLFMGACLQPPDLCIITEWCDKGSLYGLLRSKDELPFESILRMALQTATGLAYLHSKNVLHRDLKSLNLLVDAYNNIKIADFGLSKTKEVGAQLKTYAGTPNWMAPEILRTELYTEKADIFSYGMVLWEMLTKRVPHENMRGTDIRRSVGRSGMRPALPEGCPRKFATLITDCWAQNPKKRPSAQEVVYRLKRYDDQDEPPPTVLDAVAQRLQGLFRPLPPTQPQHQQQSQPQAPTTPRNTNSNTNSNNKDSIGGDAATQQP